MASWVEMEIPEPMKVKPSLRFLTILVQSINIIRDARWSARRGPSLEILRLSALSGAARQE